MSDTVIIHNVETNEIIERPMTEEELQILKSDQEKAAKEKADRIAKEAARQAVLEKLGLTADEAAALLG